MLADKNCIGIEHSKLSPAGVFVSIHLPQTSKASVKWLVGLPNSATSQDFRSISTISHLTGLYVKTMRIAATGQKRRRKERKLTIAPTSPFSPFSPGGPGRPCEEDKHPSEQSKKGHVRQHLRQCCTLKKESTDRCINAFFRCSLTGNFRRCVLNSELEEAMWWSMH